MKNTTNRPTENSISFLPFGQIVAMGYREALEEAVVGWMQDPIPDEWLFKRFRDEYVQRMSPSEAYDSIAATVDVLLEQDDESTVIEVLQTIISLAGRSETTEVPPALRNAMERIGEKVARYGDYGKNKFVELTRYYRLSG